jgi:cyclohexa-1,5-dienecarbonyl-CoA hydratase
MNARCIMWEYKKIIVEDHFEGQAMRIILNSPKGNVLDGEMMGEITAALDGARSRGDLKVIVYEGAGKHFCFGASVEEHTRERAPGMLEQFHGLFYRMMDLGIPTAAVVRGQCLGGGMELAIYCDFVFADSTALFGQPEIKLNVLPPPASIILPLRIGQARADEIILTGESIDARRALEIGVANIMIPDGREGWEFVSDWISKTLVPKSASSLRHARRCDRMHFHERIRDILPRIQKVYIEELMATHDANEGITAFLEKRKPVLKNA